MFIIPHPNTSAPRTQRMCTDAAPHDKRLKSFRKFLRIFHLWAADYIVISRGSLQRPHRFYGRRQCFVRHLKSYRKDKPSPQPFPKHPKSWELCVKVDDDLFMSRAIDSIHSFFLMRSCTFTLAVNHLPSMKSADLGWEGGRELIK